MSDFLVSMGKQYSGSDLLRLIKRPYPEHGPVGKYFDFPWGSVAILKERLANNIFEAGGAVIGWVGDLLTAISEQSLDALLKYKRFKGLRPDASAYFESDGFVQSLNGAYAVLFAHDEGFSVITDLANFIQVYSGADRSGNLASVGTHPDAVASASAEELCLDMVSLGEFLSAGTPIFPNTAYEHVKELNPATFYNIDMTAKKAEIRSFPYWSPPKELRQSYDEREHAKELEGILLSIVGDRCMGKRVGVFLSGGLDSRLIMAAIPRTFDCVGLTFCNYPNRETWTAKRVADCYRRDWFMFVRDAEFLADCMIDAIKFTGCEYEWVSAQLIGHGRDVSDLDLSVILEGTLFNDYFKAYCACDWTLQKRMGGLLPSTYRRKRYDYVNSLPEYWQKNLTNETVEQIKARRKAFFEERAEFGRGSVAEWLGVYPFSQDCTIGYWPAERRVLPVRLVAMDKRVLDFTFSCPIELKLGGRILILAARHIYGPGARIPNANDGVRPGSGHWSRLAQRTVRKLQDRTTDVLERLGKKPRVQHSWHDYPKYWKESRKLADLIQQYGANLQAFDGRLFKGRGLDLLKSEDTGWRDGFRLLQLAVWIDIIKEYKL